MSSAASEISLPDSYESYDSLREAHTALMRAYHESGANDSLTGAAEAFLQAGPAGGQYLDDPEQRLDSQRILDHWASVLYRAGAGELPDAVLDEFNPDLLPTLPDSACPYVGLEAFTESSRAQFFGREAAAESCLRKVKEARVLGVVGPSGSGKSSLIMAGVLPALEGAGRSLTMVPGSEPLKNLCAVLEVNSPAAAKALSEPVVLFVDQLEEVFTHCEALEEQAAFFDVLMALIASTVAAHTVIYTIRSDFNSRLRDFPEFYAMISAKEAEIESATLVKQELRDAIEKPAAAAGVVLKPGLTDAILRDLDGERHALPLLQFTLRALWDRRDHNRLTLEAYEKLGGARLALSNAANQFYESLLTQDQEVVRRLFLRIVRVGENLEVTRSRVLRSALHLGEQDIAAVDENLKKLLDRRLLRETNKGMPNAQIEVAHEALVRNWPRLLQWLKEADEALRNRRAWDIKAREWAQRGRGALSLLDAAQTEDAARWIKSAAAMEVGFRTDLPALIETSRTALKEQARRKRRRRTLWIWSAVGVLLATGVFILITVLAEKDKEAAVAATAAKEKERQETFALLEKVEAYYALKNDVAKAEARYALKIDESNNRISQLEGERDAANENLKVKTQEYSELTERLKLAEALISELQAKLKVQGTQNPGNLPLDGYAVSIHMSHPIQRPEAEAAQSRLLIAGAEKVDIDQVSDSRPSAGNSTDLPSSIANAVNASKPLDAIISYSKQTNENESPQVHIWLPLLADEISKQIKKLNGSDSEESSAARNRLASLGNSALKPLLASSNGASPAVSLRIAKTLRQMRQPVSLDQDAAKSAVALLKSSDVNVRREIAEFLMSFEDPESIRFVFDELEKTLTRIPSPQSQDGTAVYSAALIVGTWARTLENPELKKRALITARKWRDKLDQSSNPADWSKTRELLGELVARVEPPPFDVILQDEHATLLPVSTGGMAVYLGEFSKSDTKLTCIVFKPNSPLSNKNYDMEEIRYLFDATPGYQELPLQVGQAKPFQIGGRSFKVTAVKLDAGKLQDDYATLRFQRIP